jgi:hypothetical protein
MRFEVIGDFHEPYGAMMGDFDNGYPRFVIARTEKLFGFCGDLKNFCHNLAKALQDLCNLPSGADG